MLVVRDVEDSETECEAEILEFMETSLSHGASARACRTSYGPLPQHEHIGGLAADGILARRCGSDYLWSDGDTMVEFSMHDRSRDRFHRRPYGTLVGSESSKVR